MSKELPALVADSVSPRIGDSRRPLISTRGWLPLVLALSPVALAAQDEGEAFEDALRANRFTIELRDGRLVGAGADVLLEAGRASQFFLIGEEHGVSEIPVLTGTLFTELVDEGYRHLAVETGDVLAERLEELARSPAPLEALTRFYAEHWPGAPFYTLRTEAELLVTAVDAVDEEGVLWGLDYDVLGDRYALRQLLELATTDSQRTAVAETIEVADAALDRALEQSDPSLFMMFGGDAERWEILTEAFSPERGSRADRILTLLRETREINRLWLDGESWLSNVRRAEWNKRQLGRRWYQALDRDGVPPRVLMKFGSNHVMRGRTPTGVFDLGTVAASLADTLGRSSFHLLVVGGPGTQRAVLDPTTMEYAPAPVEIVASPWAAPLARLSFPEHWTLFDLRPLQVMAQRGQFGELAPRIERSLYGFDAVLVMTGSTPNQELD